MNQTALLKAQGGLGGSRCSSCRNRLGSMISAAAERVPKAAAESKEDKIHVLPELEAWEDGETFFPVRNPGKFPAAGSLPVPLQVPLVHVWHDPIEVCSHACLSSIRSLFYISSFLSCW
jgi:hypothetical protein